MVAPAEVPPYGRDEGPAHRRNSKAYMVAEMIKISSVLLALVLTCAPLDRLIGQSSTRIGLSQPQTEVVIDSRQIPSGAISEMKSKRQRTWTIVGGVVGAVLGYTVVRDVVEVPAGTFRAAVLAAGVGLIGAVIGYVLGS